MDWSNIVSLAFSAIGCVTGCAALVQTHNANKIAEKSLGVGEEANMLSSESNGLSSDANRNVMFVIRNRNTFDAYDVRLEADGCEPVVFGRHSKGVVAQVRVRRRRSWASG